MGRPPGSKSKSKAAMEMEDMLPEPTQDDVDLDQFLEQFGAGSAVLKVYRVPEGGSHAQPRFVEIAQYGDIDEGVMREKYGEGIYLLRFYNSTGQYVAQKKIFIDPLNKKGTSKSSGGNGDASDHMGFLRDQMAQQQTVLLALIAAMGQGMAGGANRGPDMGQLMQGMGTMMATLKPAQIDPGQIMTTIIGAVTALAPKNDDGWLDKMGKVIEISQGLRPEPHDDSLLGVARDLGAKALDAFSPRPMQHATIENRPHSTEVRQNATRIPVGATPIPQNNEKSQEDLMWEWLKVQLDYLKKKALQNKDVDFWIDSTFENDDEPGNRAILQAVSKGALFEDLLRFDPEIGQNESLKAWFLQFYDGILDGLNQPATAESGNLDTGGRSGNTADTRSDDGTSPHGKPVSGDTKPGADPKKPD